MFYHVAPIDICFLTCNCMWQISQIQTCLRVVVGPRLVSTSPAFMRSIASHPAGPHGAYWCIVGFVTSLLRHNGMDPSMTLDAAKWNGAGGELLSCTSNQHKRHQKQNRGT